MQWEAIKELLAGEEPGKIEIFKSPLSMRGGEQVGDKDKWPRRPQGGQLGEILVPRLEMMMTGIRVMVEEMDR